VPSKLHESEIKTHWHEIKKTILSHWNKLNASEVEQTHGNENSLRKLVQSKYGRLDFDSEYEKICRPFADRARKHLYGGTTPVERDLRKKTATDEYNGPDDEDEDGMSNFDDTNADYTGLALNEAQQEELLRPDLQGMEASELQTTPMNKEEYQNNVNKIIAPDEFKPNQDPRSLKSEDIKLGRSNSSANTTSSSALISSGANKKL
jgi:hypothetical protein